MDNLLEFLKGFSLQTIITIVAINGYFSHKTDQKIEKLEIDMKEQGVRIDQQGARTDHLYEMFIDLLKSQK